jgi:hypothetical protein
MEVDRSGLMLGCGSSQGFSPGFPHGFSLGFSLTFSLSFSLGLSKWFGLDANLSSGVGCGGPKPFPNFPSLSPLPSPTLSNPNAQPSKGLQLAIIITS